MLNQLIKPKKFMVHSCLSYQQQPACCALKHRTDLTDLIDFKGFWQSIGLLTAWGMEAVCRPVSTR